LGQVGGSGRVGEQLKPREDLPKALFKVRSRSKPVEIVSKSKGVIQKTRAHQYKLANANQTS
jgi:hypothetical protein